MTSISIPNRGFDLVLSLMAASATSPGFLPDKGPAAGQRKKSVHRHFKSSIIFFELPAGIVTFNVHWYKL